MRCYPSNPYNRLLADRVDPNVDRSIPAGEPHTRNAATKVLVSRLWALYAWPEQNLPVRELTVAKLLAYRAQPDYVSDEERTRKRPTREWDYGRIRHFYDCLLAGKVLDAIEVDNVCNYGRIYPEPILLDGHHRLAASYLAEASSIFIHYGGRLDLLRYLRGTRKTCPVE